MPAHFKATIFMIGAMTSFTLMAIAGRELWNRLDTFEIMMYRSIIGVVVVLSAGYWFNTLNEIRLNKVKLNNQIFIDIMF